MIVSKDLIILVADTNIEQALVGILSRPKAMSIHPIQFDHFVHPLRDPGVFMEAHDYLRPHHRRYSHALVIMDREGSGQDEKPPQEIERIIDDNLFRCGWEDRAKSIVIDPEVDIWVWAESPHVERELGWTGRQPSLMEWMISNRFLSPGQIKPDHPKEALELALKEVRKPRSSALYQTLARKVSLENCKDRAFVRLREVLQGWFAEP